MSGDGGLWRKTLVYLGLVEEPEEHDDLPERFDGGYAPHAPEPARVAEPRPVPATGPSNVRPLRVPEPGAPHVRAVDAAQGRVEVVAVTAFEDVEAIGSRFRAGMAVAIDLRATDSAIARRVLDFVSGTTYALRGKLTPTGGRTFILTPDGLELSVEERHRLADLGFGARP